MRSKLHAILGWYQLSAACLGTLLTMLAQVRAGEFRPEVLGFAAAPFVITGTAGFSLIRNRPKALGLTMIAQALQIPIIFLPSLIWRFVAGVVVSVGWSSASTSLFVGLETTWLVGMGAQVEPSVQINLVPIVVIFLALRLQGQKTERVAND